MITVFSQRLSQLQLVVCVVVVLCSSHHFYAWSANLCMCFQFLCVSLCTLRLPGQELLTNQSFKQVSPPVFQHSFFFSSWLWAFIALSPSPATQQPASAQLYSFFFFFVSFSSQCFGFHTLHCYCCSHISRAIFFRSWLKGKCHFCTIWTLILVWNMVIYPSI